MTYEVREFLTPEGKSPFRKWLNRLDLRTRARIQARVLRFEQGNLGDVRPVGGGVSEARVDFGPGYRIYFGVDGGMLVILLVGGDKSTQRNDISKAKGYWAEYGRSVDNG
ncbi:MAG: type II toxin-antitoxin system RelE/ParE family toxin [Armatimonadetes bacterium]|nr:type II toxin-antitoxin system RelE/ParE family toxin [Armatimonadota bacterium]